MRETISLGGGSMRRLLDPQLSGGRERSSGLLDANSPAVAAHNNGKTYAGDTTVSARLTGLYEPIIDASGQLVANQQVA